MRRFKHFVLAGLALLGVLTPSQAQSVWERRNPLTPTTTFNGVTWTGTRFIAVGASGTIVSSTDGVTWTTHASGTNATLYSVTWSATHKRAVAVGASGTILVSSDGANWSTRPVSGAALYTVTNNGGTFVAAGASGTIMTSSNGQDWTSQIVGGASLNAVMWSNSRFILVGSGSTILTSENGASWTSRMSPGSAVYNGLTTAGGQIIVVGTGARALSTNNGDSWTAGSVPGDFRSVALGSQLVAVGVSGAIYTSGDGASWSLRTSGTSSHLYSIASGAGKLVAVGANGVILNSNNGSDWATVSSSSAALYATTGSPTAQVAVGAGGVILVSTDHLTWSQRPSGTNQPLYGVTWTGTRFVVVGGGGTVLVSADGLTWAPRPSGVVFTLNSVAWNGTRLIATNNSSPSDGTITSIDGGETWTSTSGITSSNSFDAITSNNGSLFVAVGFNGAIRTSTNNGSSWQQRTAAPNGNRLYGVAWTGTRFVAVGAGGTIMASSDGSTSATWSAQTSNVGVTLRGVTWTGSQLVAVGDGGTVLSSSDGLAWTTRSTGTNQTLFGAGWTGSYIVAVGNAGTVVISSPAAVPPTPVLIAPLYPATGIPVNPTFSWTSTSGATSYQLQVSDNPSFSSPVLDVSDIQVSGNPSTISRTAGPLNPNTRYHWRIRATGATGSSPYTASDSFTVVAAAGSAPTNPTPADGATGVPLSTSLTWNEFPGATSYQVIFGTDSNFAAWLANDTVTAPTRLLPTLASNTTYYWKVRAMTPQGTTAYSSRWRFTSMPPLPAAPTLTAPAAEAAIAGTSVTLSWSTVTGATTYQVQVGTDSGFASGALVLNDSMGSGTSRAFSPLTANTAYYWRVRARNAGGPGAWATFRMFHTSTVLPGAPTPSSPTEGQTVSVYSVAFAWTTATNAVRYRLRVGTDTGITTPVFDTTVTGSSVTMNRQLANSTLYYWRVQAVNYLGSTNSPRRGFVSGMAHTAPPPAPTPLAPTQFATGISSSSVGFAWSAANTATHYRLQVARDAAFTNVVFLDSGLTQTSRAVTGLAGGASHYWRVAAKNQVGWSAYSEIFSFATAATVPPAPVLDAPSAFALGVSVTPTLTWFRAHSATSYRLQVSLASNFVVLLRNDSLSDTSATLPTLGNNTDYYWRVSARNSAGVSEYSTVRRFTTGTAPLPAIPNLLSPQQFANDVPLSPVLTWEPASYASSYHLQVASDAGFTLLAFQDSTIAGPTRTVPTLAKGTDFYWRVRSKNSAGVSAYSGTRRFTTTVNSALIPGHQALRRVAHGGAGGLRFGLAVREKVIVRYFDTQGRQVAKALEAYFDPGYHVLALPVELQGTFYLLDFQAGNSHRTLKMHP